MKKHIWGFIATLSLFVFSIGIHPTCLSSFYQPELPEELK
ncbi:cyclic lactone autoinducer peptide [Pelotomaculum terephthalicicum JT]|nr:MULTISPECIES: cyclic lactone autoinducer peptide [Pelotomaculum]MCG9968562.1 cyclic lactone autoinducer peptide [Pelotomaculum terephthalicicum JT]OPX87424.1 MAG: hypothetical protein A4E54_01706 [Pelotomaculum sp. PtaB.Bin117]OPY61074.1 MAG: hypothetical protein A4E56_02276 [Pelotomaculum sp. PtaU1.Bin065]